MMELHRVVLLFLGGLRMRVYELGAEASLEEVLDLAERVELAQRKYEAYLPRPTERSRRPTWAAAIIPEGGGRTDARGDSGIDTRTCHRCGKPGHLRRDCKNCDGCEKLGHRKRECPDAARCEICKKRGHEAKDCYQREGGIRRHPEELQQQISRLQAQLRATGLRGEAEAGMYARDEEGEEVEQDVQCALMAWRGREEMGLRRGGKDGRRELGKKEQVKGEKPTEPALERAPARHPQERLACQTSVLLLEKGAMEVEGEKSEDFDVLVGTELVYAVGMKICTWTEKVEFRTRYWKKEGPLGELPVRFVKVEPKRVYQAAEGPPPVEQGGPPGLGGAPRMKRMDKPQQQSDWQQPIHLVELFGGIGGGLSAVVRNGIAVRRWTYVEKEPVVRRMAEHHARKLQAEYPELLSERVIREAMGGTTHDVKEISEAEVASWGQERQGRVAYLLENLDLEGDSREPIRLVRDRIRGQLGEGVSCDAARMGSYAHRLRMYWQNVVPAMQLQAEIEGVKRAAERKVQDILAPRRTPAPVCRKSYSRHEQCNQVGQEREDATAAPGASEADRRRALGNAMDGHVLRWLVQRMWREMVVSWGQEEEKGGVEAEPRGAWSCQEMGEESWVVGEAMSKEGKDAMQELLARHRKCFAFTMQELGRCKVKEMELKLSSTEPVRDLTGEVLSRRMCGDYRALNKITVADRYSMPMAEEIFDKLAEGVFFTTLDLRQGFNQIKIREELIKKTAFHGPDGLYEWLYMPFGLRNASAVFQRVMDSVLRGLECAACYIDDVVIFSTTEQQHLQDVERTLTAIEAAGLTCHPKKCRWGEQTVQYLGYEVKGGQIGIQQAKVAVLDRLREPKDKSGLRVVLGFLSYYRRFVPNFSKRAAVLNGLLREDKAWEWGEAQKGALQDLMAAVKTATVLKLPTADLPFTLYTDWSSQGMGGIICQEVEGEEKVVAYASRSCNSAEAQYSSYIGEGLAAVWAVGHFRVYLQGREFTLVTYLQPLMWLMTTPGLTDRNARWAMKLQQYDFKIKHRPGKTLQHVDGLSRNPPPPEPTVTLHCWPGRRS
ncbi:unnamed protein product [Closterium sp. NIES-54]